MGWLVDVLHMHKIQEASFPVPKRVIWVAWLAETRHAGMPVVKYECLRDQA